MNLKEIKEKWKNIQNYLPLKQSGRNNKIMEVLNEIPYLIKEIENKENSIWQKIIKFLIK